MVSAAVRGTVSRGAHLLLPDAPDSPIVAMNKGLGHPQIPFISVTWRIHITEVPAGRWTQTRPVPYDL